MAATLSNRRTTSEGTQGQPESHASGSQIPPQLRSRTLNRSATLEGAPVDRSLTPRRRATFPAYSNDASYSFSRSDANDMEDWSSSEALWHWDSAPLAFIVFPALGGLFMKNGGAHFTDISFLILGLMFLNWCLKAPWRWYHAAERSRDAEMEAKRSADSREENEGFRAEEVSADTFGVAKGTGEEANKPEEAALPSQHDTSAAERLLSEEEAWALLTCFLAPIAGAIVLHAIRSQLNRPPDGIVENTNLTLFVAVAEFRPLSHVLNLRTAHLTRAHRIPDAQNGARLDSAGLQDIVNRVTDLEERVAEPVRVIADSESSRMNAVAQKNLQSQLDALYRAVRRYEKRHVTFEQRTEERFKALEAEVKDALALAAAAARTAHRPGMVSRALTWLVTLASDVFNTGWAIVSYPWRLAHYMMSEAKSSLFVVSRPRQRR
ncbi:uncharacterized protein EI97DRAFT_461695 [Westerdykella ornata]|uniref:Uncharacterized protein n=1 Tax=Westerdykella ornata TaxID=318751 RepID=A0A6A6J8J9_WESOR|nr:uncharacterized protein EI97DRAFT_461695 [Westerdykella ornata]KAF2272752.1 hypothetical protein EI97DRAFT_461695 [Westerdykella ornata]